MRVMNTIQQLRFLKSCIAFAKDIDKTDQLYATIDSMRNEESAVWQVAAQHMSRYPENVDCIRQKRPLSIPTIDELLQFQTNTLGYHYGDFLRANNLNLVFYPKLNQTTDFDFVGMRLRQTHDLWHVVTGFNAKPEGEMGLLAFYLGQLNSPLSGVLVGLVLINQSLYQPTNLHNATNHLMAGLDMGRSARQVFPLPFDQLFNKDLQELRKELGITPYHSPTQASVEIRKESLN